MGEANSKPVTHGHVHHEAPTLIEQISADIADGNEGDMLDMQAKQSQDKSCPHLYQMNSYISEHTRSTAQESLGSSSAGKSPQKHGLYFDKGEALRKSKTTPRESLKSDFSEEESQELLDENTFRQEIKRSRTEKNDKEGYVRQEDSYEEFITKLVE